MSWARIMTPLAGGAADAAALEAGSALAAAFGAELAGVYAPADVAELTPWMGEGFMGGLQITAIESLREAAEAGEAAARSAFAACSYGKAKFMAVESPVWAALAMESRLSDVVVFADAAAKQRGPLAEAFEQIVAGEQRPTLVARPGFKVDGLVTVAWDGGKEASRAVRTALPLLQKASQVVIVSAPGSASRTFDPARLQGFLADRGVKAELEVLAGSAGDVGSVLLGAATAAGANLLVAGAFGHPRLQEFIFGGATRTLLSADGPSLFLSH